jgi:GDPmannose 4,6-dehydratase
LTQKIVASAVRIAAGQQDRLYLGNIEIQRDWGWAEDYVVAMYLMLQQEQFSFRATKPTFYVV